MWFGRSSFTHSTQKGSRFRSQTEMSESSWAGRLKHGYSCHRVILAGGEGKGKVVSGDMCLCIISAFGNTDHIEGHHLWFLTNTRTRCCAPRHHARGVTVIRSERKCVRHADSGGMGMHGFLSSSPSHTPSGGGLSLSCSTGQGPGAMRIRALPKGVALRPSDGRQVVVVGKASVE